MKQSVKLLLVLILLGFSSISSLVYGQAPLTLVPVKPGLGGNTGGSRSPEEYSCPLSLYYNETTSQLEFENQKSSSVTFTYYIYDDDDNIVDYDTICINENTSYMLYLNSNASETYKIQIKVDNVVYEGYFGT